MMNNYELNYRKRVSQIQNKCAKHFYATLTRANSEFPSDLFKVYKYDTF